MKYFIGVALFMISVSTMAATCAQHKNTMRALVGVESVSGNLYAALSSPSKSCGCTYARFSHANVDTKLILSLLLTAKLSDKTVRIDFLNNGDCNSAYRAYLD